MLAEERQARGQQQPREHQPHGISYLDFERLQPPVFTTCPEPLAADDWLRTIQSKFTLLPGLTDRGTSPLGRNSIRLIELTILRQDLWSRCSYSPEDVTTDPRWAALLLDGFDPTLRTHLERRYESYTDLVDTALDMENHLHAANENQKRKCQASTVAASSSQKEKFFSEGEGSIQTSTAVLPAASLCDPAQSAGLDPQGASAAAVPRL
ncbi:hypothetical protein U9M48_035166 [Paspalum notatum var. saurae]|uniref:Uncharacterized protein n=1 Tax=Paspalum notatum var. saurae TaxID=547442 RepID=A0AAQ3UG24_PASNO